MSDFNDKLVNTLHHVNSILDAIQNLPSSAISFELKSLIQDLQSNLNQFLSTTSPYEDTKTITVYNYRHKFMLYGSFTLLCNIEEKSNSTIKEELTDYFLLLQTLPSLKLRKKEFSTFISALSDLYYHTRDFYTFMNIVKIGLKQQLLDIDNAINILKMVSHYTRDHETFFNMIKEIEWPTYVKQELISHTMNSVLDKLKTDLAVIFLEDTEMQRKAYDTIYAILLEDKQLTEYLLF